MTAMNVFFAGVPVSATRQHARGTSIYLGFAREFQAAVLDQVFVSETNGNVPA
jgi:hypothetical protein